MGQSEKPTEPIQTLLKMGEKEERRLLKRERRAEREVTKAHAALANEEARLRRMQQRVDHLRAEVATAEAALGAAQAARAAGPDLSRDPNAVSGANERAMDQVHALPAATNDEAVP